MRWRASVGNFWRRWESPITIGAIVGLGTGFVGIVVAQLLFSTSLGGLLGAVGCGITVAYRSNERLRTVLFQALIADVVSSIVFFVLVYLAYITMVTLTEGFFILGAIYFGLLYLVFGGTVAVPVAILSLGITGVSTMTTLFLTRSRAGSASVQ